jgi:hypothetical protein
MIIIYIVFIDCGFGGVKYFQKKENAENYVKNNGGELYVETATPKEYGKINFSDFIKEF